MNRVSKKATYFLALCLGFASAGLFACGNDAPQKTAAKVKDVVPDGFAEQRQLASAVDSLGSFDGTVVFPTEEGISVHGKAVEGGVPAVLKFLQERKTGLNYIYRKYQAIKPGFEGSLSLDITVDVCGDVYSIAEISSTTGVPEFNAEVKNSLSRQKFPKTDQGHYTLSFVLNFVKESPALDTLATAVVDSSKVSTVDSLQKKLNP